MTEKPHVLTVEIKYGNVEKTFAGSPEDVWLAVNRFFGEFLPSFEIANKLVLDVDLKKLAVECEGLVAFSPEGPNLLVARNKLTDNETLQMLLLANHVGFKIGKVESDAMSKDELQAKLGKDSKITSTRLGELAKAEIVAKTSDERYRITTFGIVQMQRDVLPKVRAKAAV